MSTWLAVVNPCSGQFKSSGFEQRWLPELRDLVDEIVFTDAEGSATGIAQEADEVDGFVVVGGDGTVLELIDGMQRERQQLAVIPTGRGNSLARDLGIKTVADGLAALRGDADVWIDLMRAGVGLENGSRITHLSASTLALGYVVRVVDRASSFRMAGPYGYALATLLTKPSSFSCRLDMTDNDQQDRSCTGIVINNTVNLANFPAFKTADMQDGLLDILILDAGWFGQTLHNLSILSALGFHEVGVRSQHKGISISLDAPHLLMIDGQLMNDVMSLEVECVPAALRCKKVSAS